MVKFIPPYCGEEIKSNAEKKVFGILEDLKIKNGYVLHSLGLPKHQSKIYGEIDFVIVCERGICCLEIKGGRVACRDGAWYFTDRYGNECRKAEGPFAQVVGNMFSLKTVLKEQFKDKLWIKNLLFACGVMFPDISFRSDAEEAIPEMVYDAGTGDISSYIERIFTYWEGRRPGSYRNLSPGNIEEIVRFLRNDFTFIPSLRTRLDTVDDRLIRLTREQSVILQALSMNPRLLIEGGAGTGKTLLAMEYAKEEKKRGKKILYLTYNKNLANAVRTQMGMENGDDLKIINIHALFGELAGIDAEEIKKDPMTYFSERLPDEFSEKLKNLSKEELAALQYDCLIMDEGQDILKPDYLYALDYLLKGGLENGSWSVFFDKNQNIYNPDFDEGLELMLSFSCTRFKLFTNCRNTVQIGEFNTKISGTQLGDFLKQRGEEVHVCSYLDNEDFQKQVLKIVKEMRAEHIPLDEIVFLSPKRFPNSKLSVIDSRKLSVNEISDGMTPAADTPNFATIPGFKGLDAKIIILLDVDQIRREDYSRYLYIACSRARSLLYVIVPEETKEAWEV